MTTPDLWNAVDLYIDDALNISDPALDAVLAASEAAGLPAIQVAPNQGRLLLLLAQSIGARHILEIGTLGGYSTLWLARALSPDGRIMTLELDPKHAEVAHANFAGAGVGGQIEVRVGAALDSLAQIAESGLPPFDFVFIDADKANLVSYFDWSVRLARPGTLIVLDNVVRQGEVLDASSPDASVQGVRAWYAHARQTPNVVVTALQTVGSKGYDGFALARVTG